MLYGAVWNVNICLTLKTLSIVNVLFPYQSYSENWLTPVQVPLLSFCTMCIFTCMCRGLIHNTKQNFCSTDIMCPVCTAPNSRICSIKVILLLLCACIELLLTEF